MKSGFMMDNAIEKPPERLQTAGLTVATPWDPYLGWTDHVIFFDADPEPTAYSSRVHGFCSFSP